MRNTYSVETVHPAGYMNGVHSLEVQTNNDGSRNVIGDKFGYSRDYRVATDADAIHAFLPEHGMRAKSITIATPKATTNNAAKLHAECNALVSAILDNDLCRTLKSVFVARHNDRFHIDAKRSIINSVGVSLGKVMIRTIDGTPLSREDIYEQVRKLIAPYYL